MNKYGILIIIVVAALVIGRLISPLAVQAQDEDGDSIRDQIRIMTRILQASIGKDSIDRRLHLSVFDSRIRAEYIPTVGAIFTIPIAFPLHPSKDEKGNGAEDSVEEDLWEHFQNANERASRSAAPTLPAIEPVEAVEPLNIRIKIEKDRLDEQLDRLRDQTERATAKTYAVAGQDLLLSIQDGFGWDLSFGGSKPYDPVKVSTLTHTIIETIAHYGHRLNRIPNSERVLVVLEAPQPRGSAIARFSRDDENAALSPKLAPAPPAGEVLKEKRKIIKLEVNERRERGDRFRGVYAPGAIWIPTLSLQGERDHRLLAFKKSDLQQERSYDSIKSKVETTDY